MPRISHKDIAEKAGVSQSTVSRALAGHRGIPKETVLKVKRAAEGLGYRPDPNLAVVAAHRWRRGERAVEPTIAMVLEKRRGQINDIGDNTDLPEGMKLRAEALGYKTEVFYREDYKDAEALERVLLARGIRGLVVGPVYDNFPRKDLDWNKFVAVAASPGAYTPSIPAVRVDMFTAVTLAWDKVVEAGHKRIGAALYEHGLSLREDDLRASAVYCCQKRRYPQLAEIPTLKYTHETKPEVFGEWVRKNGIEAVVGFNSVVYWEMTYAGIRIPEEVAFAELHVVSKESGMAGILTGGRHTGAELLETLHRGLLANAYGSPEPKVEHLVYPTWVDGASLPKRGTK